MSVRGRTRVPAELCHFQRLPAFAAVRGLRKCFYRHRTHGNSSMLSRRIFVSLSDWNTCHLRQDIAVTAGIQPLEGGPMEFVWESGASAPKTRKRTKQDKFASSCRKRLSANRFVFHPAKIASDARKNVFMALSLPRGLVGAKDLSRKAARAPSVWVIIILSQS